MLTTLYKITTSLIAASLITSAQANQITVNFSATYTAATCTISAPASVSFNQGTHAQGVYSSDIQGEAIQQPFTLQFSDCNNISGVSALPSILVAGTVVTLNGEQLFSDNTGKSGEAIGYGVRLSTAGNSFFNTAENLAANNILSAPPGTRVENLNNQQLNMKAVLTCGQQDCADMTDRRGGELTARVIFRLRYE